MTNTFDSIRQVGPDCGEILSVIEILLRITMLPVLATTAVIGLRRSSAVHRQLVWILLVQGMLLVSCAIPKTGYAQTQMESTTGENKPASDLKIVIQAVDGGTSKPLADALIEISTSNINQGDPQNTSQKTDEQGKAEIVIPDVAKRNYINIAIRPAGYVPQYYIWTPRIYQSHIPVIDSKLLAMRFKKGIKIGGRVEDESGKAVSNADINITLPATFADRGENYAFHLADIKTDGEGRWQCDCAPEDFAEMHNITFINPDFIEKSIRPDLEMKELNHVVRMERGLVVTGRIFNEDMKPVAGASISVSGPSRPGSITAKTDADGRFELKPCQAGRLTRIMIIADGFAPQFEMFTPTKEPMKLAYHLEPGATISGKVVDPQGKPVEGVWVFAARWKMDSLNIKMTTDKDGRFAWKSAPQDMVYFDILPVGYMPIRNYPLTPNGEEHLISLYPKLVIQGAVVDEENGKPVENFRLVRGSAVMEGSKEIRFDKSYVLCKEGHFEFPVGEPSPGIYLKVEAEGYRPAVSREFKSDEGRQVFDFKLKKGTKAELEDYLPAAPRESKANENRQTLAKDRNTPEKEVKGKEGTGLVLQSDGTPAVNAMVMVATRRAHAYLENGRGHPMNPAPTYHTNAQGRFTVMQPDLAVKPDSNCHIFVVHDSGFAEASPGDFATTRTIKLQPWGRLEGTMHVGRDLAKNEHVMYEPTFQRETRQYIFSGTYETITDDKGHFVMERVIPGNGFAARVIVEPSSNGIGRHNTFVDRTNVEIASGKTAHVEIGGRGRPVAGRLDLDNSAVKLTENTFGSIETRVRNDNDHSRFYTFRVNKDGSFRIDDVVTGDYLLKVEINKDWERRDNIIIAGQFVKIGEARAAFSMPEIPEGYSEEPLDLGTLKIE